MSSIKSLIHNNLISAILLACLSLLFILRIDMNFRFEGNWDEYLNLSMLHGFASGDLNEPLQTAFVHFFFWLPEVSVNEMTQVVAGRLFVMLFTIVTSLAIYKIASKFQSKEAAIFAVLSYWCFSYILRHGISVRTDPMAIACIMGAIWAVIDRPSDWRRAIIAGVSLGLAGIMTIKSALLLPTVISYFLAAVAHQNQLHKAWKMLVLGSLSGLIVFMGITSAHMISLPNAASPFEFLSRTSSATLATQDFSILKRYLSDGFKQNFAFFVLLLIGLLSTIKSLKGGNNYSRVLFILSGVFALLTPLIYRETYPYYFAFMLAPAMIIVAAGFDWIVALKRRSITILIILASFAPALIQYERSIAQGPQAQYMTLELIHKIFPEPVPYIDARTMVSSFPKQGLFMSNWGMRDYKTRGELVMTDVLADAQPMFVLANKPELDLDNITPAQSDALKAGLMADDLKVLQNNFVHYWGPIYVAGFKLSPEQTTLSVTIPASYQLSAGHRVSINGQVLDKGQSIDLLQENYKVQTQSDAVLRLELPEPPTTEFSTPLFRGF